MLSGQYVKNIPSGVILRRKERDVDLRDVLSKYGICVLVHLPDSGVGFIEELRQMMQLIRESYTGKHDLFAAVVVRCNAQEALKFSQKHGIRKKALSVIADCTGSLTEAFRRNSCDLNMPFMNFLAASSYGFTLEGKESILDQNVVQRILLKIGGTPDYLLNTKVNIWRHHLSHSIDGLDKVLFMVPGGSTVSSSSILSDDSWAAASIAGSQYHHRTSMHTRNRVNGSGENYDIYTRKDSDEVSDYLRVILDQANIIVGEKVVVVYSRPLYDSIEFLVNEGEIGRSLDEGFYKYTVCESAGGGGFLKRVHIFHPKTNQAGTALRVEAERHNLNILFMPVIIGGKNVHAGTLLRVIPDTEDVSMNIKKSRDWGRIWDQALPGICKCYPGSHIIDHPFSDNMKALSLCHFTGPSAIGLVESTIIKYRHKYPAPAVPVSRYLQISKLVVSSLLPDVSELVNLVVIPQAIDTLFVRGAAFSGMFYLTTASKE